MSLRRIDHSSRGVPPTVARRCVWSRNLGNKEAKARYRDVKIQPQWIVTPGKQTTNNIYIYSLDTVIKLRYFSEALNKTMNSKLLFNIILIKVYDKFWVPTLFQRIFERSIIKIVACYQSLCCWMKPIQAFVFFYDTKSVFISGL